MNEEVIKTVEEQKEERLNKMRVMALAAFPDYKVEKDGKYVRVTSNNEMFLSSELKRVEAISSLNGNNGYFINASVGFGLQAVLF